MVSDVECTTRDLEWMRRCDLFVAFPGEPVSPGTHVEIGWASALGRPTVLLTEPGRSYAALVTGLPSVAPVRLLVHHGGRTFPDELAAVVAELLPDTVPAPAGRP